MRPGHSVRSRAIACLVVATSSLGVGGCYDTPSKHEVQELGAGAAVLVAAGAAGAIIEGLKPTPPGHPVFARDFRREAEEKANKETGADSGANGAPVARRLDGSTVEVEIVPPEAVDAGVGSVKATPGEPTFIASSVTDAAPAGESMLVDAIVGEISGKPVRASEFLAPMRESLIALAKEPGMTRDAWKYSASKKILQRLQTQLTNELLTSAGMADLTAAEQEQLAVYMIEVKRRALATSRGSEEAADRKLRAEGRGGLAQYLEETKRQMIIQNIIEQHIKPRIQVTMHDIEVYYRQHPEKYDSPNLYVFRMIEADPKSAESATKITARLDAGDSFQAVASSELNSFHREEGGAFSTEYASAKPQTESDFFPDPALNDTARKLKVGGWHGPIEFDGSAHWLYLEKIVDRTKTLFDAQVEIENAVRAQRFESELEKYLAQLSTRGSYTALDEMTMRLGKIAEHQILGPVKSGAGVDSVATPTAGSEER